MRILRIDQDMVLVYQAERPGLAPTLVFESAGLSVTLEKFPADWRRFSDAELLRLRAGASYAD